MISKGSTIKLVNFVLIGICTLFLSFACKPTTTKPPKRNENKVYFAKIEKAARKEPTRQLEKKLFAKPSEVIVKAEKAVKVLKSLPGGNEAISALSSPQQALLSSSSALGSLEPAGWWTPTESTGGIPGAQIALSIWEFWNMDVTHGLKVSHLANQNFVNFAGYPNADLNPDAVFPTGGPNGIMQFVFGSSPKTILGIFKFTGIGANVDVYLEGTLIANYFVNGSEENYPFLVNVPDGSHTITAVYSSSSVDVGAQGLLFWSLTLYVI
jgi:hypothetical protein